MSNVYILLLICLLLSCQTSDDLNYNDNEINKSNILLIITDDMGLDASVGYNIGNQNPKCQIFNN